MYRITEIALPLDGQEQELRALAAKRLHVEPERVCALSLVKKMCIRDSLYPVFGEALTGSWRMRSIAGRYSSC